ncbi:uncharacterized protein LOC128193554 [Vigna angularis]|uniref:uncharacterized protein LOC128193554 n=1 Tax=Phaseolus angularis TaxID=3914 RepID=UPI0022B3D022|nr:uncharacterized protein LOC128193554 [Vigna angularis]
MTSKGLRSKIDHESRAKLQKVSFNLLEKYLEAHSKASMWENELLDVGYQPLSIQIPYTMPVKNVVSWNSIIWCLVQEGLYTEAMELFHRMCISDMIPDNVGAIMSIKNFNNLFNNSHQRIGVALYGIIWLQVLFGLSRPQRACSVMEKGASRKQREGKEKCKRFHQA